jgi:elongation factor Ts
MNTELIKELRARTSAGMADCKAALVEAEWDLDKAQDLVKARGLAQTSRNASKVASEGRITIYYGGDYGSPYDHATLSEINCQTDFVANSPDFCLFVELVGHTLSKTDLAAFSGDLNQLPVISPSADQNLTQPPSLEDLRKEIAGKTKENIVVRRWMREEVSGDNRRVFSYLHSNNELGVLVSVEAPSKEAALSDDFTEFANNVAMQIAAMNPLAVSVDRLSQEDCERQKAIFETQLKEANKPEASWSRIIEGKTKKWHSDVVLLEQESVLHPKTSIRAVADDLSKKLSGETGKVKVLNFLRCQVGEGIEKAPQEDYGAEISKMTGVVLETQ